MRRAWPPQLLLSALGPFRCRQRDVRKDQKSFGRKSGRLRFESRRRSFEVLNKKTGVGVANRMEPKARPQLVPLDDALLNLRRLRALCPLIAAAVCECLLCSSPIRIFWIFLAQCVVMAPSTSIAAKATACPFSPSGGNGWSSRCNHTANAAFAPEAFRYFFPEPSCQVAKSPGTDQRQMKR
jgi:hypothetical protein